MVRINFDIHEYDYMSFQNIVGKGNVSASLRNYVKSTITTGKDNEKEYIIRKKLIKIEEEKRKTDTEYNKLKAKIDIIDMKKKQEEIKKLEDQEKERKKWNKIKGDTMRENLHRMV